MDELARKVNIPATLAELGVNQGDIDKLSESTLNDVCCLTNPRQATKQEIAEIFQAAW